MAGADWRAGKIEEYQSQHVPIRSKIRALGLEGFGAAEAIWDIEQLPKDSSQVVAHESRVSTSEWVTVGLGNVQLAIAKFSLKLGILLCNHHPDPLQQSCIN